MAAATGRSRRRANSEMNVVPFIDVMLVLLVIFMAVAPILTQGILIDLPPADAEPMPASALDEPLIVTVRADGSLFLNVGGSVEEAGQRASALVSATQLADQASRVLRVRPDTPVLIHGHADLPYGRAVEIMALLQRAGAASVGLITDPASGADDGA